MQAMQHDHQNVERVAESEFYTIGEAARALQVSPSTVWRWIDKGRLNAYRVGEKKIRIEREELARAVKPFTRERRRGGAMTKETETGVRIMAASAAAKNDQLAVVEEARRLQEQILARRRGRPLPASYKDIEKARRARSAGA